MAVSTIKRPGAAHYVSVKFAAWFCVLVVVAVAIVIATPQLAFAASSLGTYENDSSQLSYTGTSWATSTSSSDSGGSVAYTTRSGDVSFTFTGPAIAWVSRLTNSSGINDVYIDGTKVASVDRYSATIAYKQTVFEKRDLTNSTHTIRVVWTGAKNAAAIGSNLTVDAFIVEDIDPPPAPSGLAGNVSGTGITLTWDASAATDVAGYRIYRSTAGANFVNITSSLESATTHLDPALTPSTTYQYRVTAVDVSGNESSNSSTISVITAAGAGTGRYENDSSLITYEGSSWSTSVATDDSGGAVSYTTRSGAVSFNFNGPAIAWVSRLSSTSGINDVYIDGSKVASIDRYSAVTVYNQKVFEKRDLTNAEHSIRIVWTGAKNSAASGSNLTVDAFEVEDIVPPATPTTLAGAQTGTGLMITWKASPDADVVGYRLYRALKTGTFTLISDLQTSTSFNDVGLVPQTVYRYQVSAVDTSGNESPLSAIKSLTTSPKLALTTNRFSNCPAATVTVTNRTELTSALSAAGPGAVIWLAPGTYTGSYTVTKSGTASSPIWICGSKSAIIDNGDYKSGQGFYLSSVSYVTITGFTIKNSMKGVSVVGGDHDTVSDLSISSIGYEAIHLRDFTVDSNVIANVIRQTGRLDVSFGEGIYIGTSGANWCSITNCLPDNTDRNTIALNNIAATGAQPIELKEGTSGGVVYQNTINGAQGVTTSIAWILVKGNGYTIDGNTGLNSPANGIVEIASAGGWGVNNIFVNNKATLNSSGYAIWLNKDTGNVVGCENTAVNAGSGLTNVVCQP